MFIKILQSARFSKVKRTTSLKLKMLRYLYILYQIRVVLFAYENWANFFNQYVYCMYKRIDIFVVITFVILQIFNSLNVMLYELYLKLENMINLF